MPFNRKPQKFNAAIKSVVIGSGDKTVTLGGENVLPFYAFDGEIKNGPKVGVEITDLGMEGEPESVKAYYEGAATMGEIAKKAAAMEGADFVALILERGDPIGVNKSVDELIAVVKDVADSIDAPLVVEGCKNVEKDAELLPKVAEALQGRNILILSEKEENYKAIGAAAGLAYTQIVGALDVGGILCRRDDDDRDLVQPCVVLHHPQHIKAVHAGHHQVQQQQRDIRALPHQLHCRCAVLCFQVVIAIAQYLLEQGTVDLGIIRDQDLRFLVHGHVSPFAAHPSAPALFRVRCLH